MTRRILLTLAGLVAAAGGLVAAEPRKPNVIVILADDMGYADVGVNGCKDIPTPNIDSLAKNGVRCSNGYVSHPYCSPTRAGMLTGRYQQRYGHEFNPGPPTDTTAGVGLPLTETTLADRLKAAGYKTGLVGKWHLGHAEEKFYPQNRRFDEFFGFLGGAHRYGRDLPRQGGGPGEGISDRRVRSRGLGVHREAQGRAVLPVLGVQRGPRADGSGRKIPQAVPGHQGREAPHLCRHALGPRRRD